MSLFDHAARRALSTLDTAFAVPVTVRPRARVGGVNGGLQADPAREPFETLATFYDDQTAFDRSTYGEADGVFTTGTADRPAARRRVQVFASLRAVDGKDIRIGDLVETDSGKAYEIAATWRDGDYGLLAGLVARAPGTL